MSTQKFGDTYGDFALAVAERMVIGDVLRFIQNGLKDFTGTRDELKLEALRGLLEGYCVQKIAGGGLVLKADRVAKSLEGTSMSLAREKAFAGFLVSFDHFSRYVGSVPPPCIGALPMEREASIALEVTGKNMLAAPAADEGMLRQAYDMALLNISRAEQRLVALSVLGDLVSLRKNSVQENPLAEKDFDETYAYLWAQRAKHMLSALALGTLIGPSVAARNKELVKKLYGPDAVLIHLLQVDAGHPGMYESKLDDDLRAEIDAALNS